MSAWEGLTGRMEGELVVVEPLAAEHEAGLLERVTTEACGPTSLRSPMGGRHLSVFIAG